MPTKRVPELNELSPLILKVRRHLHRHPELSHQEHETAAFLADHLGRWGIEHTTGMAGTGVVAVIEGGAGDGPTVGIRGDMDALPIQEERQHSYRSTRSGVMHACGHDAHCAMVLGAAKILNSRRDALRGRIKIVFQPSEEVEPSGAEAMISEGVLESPHVDAMLGLHVFPHLRSGLVAIKPGPASAYADEFFIDVHGRGGHAGYPHLTVDPIVASAHVIIALQTIASRRTRPNDPVVVTVGRVMGGTAANVIPQTMRLHGTFRTLNPQVRDNVAEEIDRIAQGVANAHGATAEVKIEWGCPAIFNHVGMSEMLLGVGEQIVGEGNVARLPEALMGADDFAFYSQQVPSICFRLGTGNADKGTEFPLHHPRFDIDEDTLPIGTAVLVEMAQRLCSEGIPPEG